MTAKALILSGGDGTAVPVNYLGEKISGTTTTSTQNFTTTSFVDQTGFSLTLGAGIYDIISETSDSSTIPGSPGSSGAYTTIIAIADSANNIYGEGSFGIQFTSGIGGATSAGRVVVTARNVLVTSSTTFKIRRRLSAIGNSHNHTSNSGNADSSLGPQFYAIRKA